MNKVYRENIEYYMRVLNNFKEEFGSIFGLTEEVMPPKDVEQLNILLSFLLQDALILLQETKIQGEN